MFWKWTCQSIISNFKNYLSIYLHCPSLPLFCRPETDSIIYCYYVLINTYIACCYFNWLFKKLTLLPFSFGVWNLSLLSQRRLQNLNKSISPKEKLRIDHVIWLIEERAVTSYLEISFMKQIPVFIKLKENREFNKNSSM